MNPRYIAATNNLLAAYQRFRDANQAWSIVLAAHQKALKQGIYVRDPAEWPEAIEMFAASEECKRCKTEWDEALAEVTAHCTENIAANHPFLHTVLKKNLEGASVVR